MSDRKLTLLELHFGDVQIGPRSSGDDGREPEEESGTDLEGGGGRTVPVGKKAVVGTLLGIVVLGGAAAAAKALLGGDEEDPSLEGTTVGEQEELGSTEFED